MDIFYNLIKKMTYLTQKLSQEPKIVNTINCVLESLNLNKEPILYPHRTKNSLNVQSDSQLFDLIIRNTKQEKSLTKDFVKGVCARYNVLKFSSYIYFDHSNKEKIWRWLLSIRYKEENICHVSILNKI